MIWFALLISAHNLPVKTWGIIQGYYHFRDEVHMDKETSNNDSLVDHIDFQGCCVKLAAGPRGSENP